MASADRYDRQIRHWGRTVQQRIEKSTVLVAGVGGLGTTVSQLLARAGVGKLILVDNGTIDWPDLNRQLLYTEKDVGRRKLDIAAERLREINSATQLERLNGPIDSTFALSGQTLLAADCLDNYAARFALADALPEGGFLVHGGLAGDQGQVLTLHKGRSRPLQEIFAGLEQPTESIPATGAGAVVIAGLMVNELCNLIAGQPQLLDRFLIISLNDLNVSFLDV